VIDRQYQAEEILSIDGVDVQRCINELQSLSPTEKQEIRCVKGHAPFGLHRWLPQPAAYLTLIRNPLERIVSEYCYVRRTTQHPFHEELVARDLSLLDYVRIDIEWAKDNLQTRWIAGLVDMHNALPPYDPLPSDALSVARRNLETHFVVVGLTDRFDEALLLMQKILGWGNIFYRRKNVSPDRPSVEEIGTATRRLVETHNQLDLELWEFASARFEEMLEEHRISALKVSAFRAMNRFYASFERMRNLAREHAFLA
jgi:hypothetical protein